MFTLSNLTKELLEKEYCTNLLTQKEIAKKYCTSETKVWGLMKKWGILAIYNRTFLKRRVLELTPLQKEVLLGTICGDGHVQRNSSGNSHFEVSHSIKQLDLLVYKAGVLRDWIPSPEPYKVVQESYRSSKDPDKKYYRVEFHTIVAPVFNELHDLFYINGIKTISKDVLDQMTLRSLALWYQDDGGYSGNTLDINGRWTDVSKQEIITWFKNRWNINIQIRNYRRSAGTDRITFSVKESERFGELIFPFVIPSMRYKFKHIKIPLSSEITRQAPSSEG